MSYRKRISNTGKLSIITIEIALTRSLRKLLRRQIWGGQVIFMSDDEPINATERFERAVEDAKQANYILRLYVAGNTSKKSAEAIRNIREVCEKKLQGRYTLEVIDITQQPGLAREEQIIAVPTLIKMLPQPLKRVVGDLSSIEHVLVGLNLEKMEA